jgi:outer membrane protein
MDSVSLPLSLEGGVGETKTEKPQSAKSKKSAEPKSREQIALEKRNAEMQAELEKSAAAMQSASANWSELRKQQETKQLQDAYANIQSYMQSAQESLQTKEVELLTPVLEKMQKAIEEVAAAQKLAYVIDSSRSKGVLVYQKGGDNLMKAVKTKLAIK